jgi:hypothetical protein
MTPLPVPMESVLFAVAAKVALAAFGASAAILTWSCLALSGRWSDLDDRLGPPITRPVR